MVSTARPKTMKAFSGRNETLHILYLHQYFATRTGYTGTRSYEFARRLIAKGHRVVMVTSGRDAEPAYTVPVDKQYVETEIDGIHVVAINAAYNNSMAGTNLSGVRRMRDFLDFAGLATWVGKRLDRPDVVFATHTPLTIGLSGMKLGRFFDVPFVFEVRDLWPQGLINFGALKNPLVIWWLRRMERRIYNAATHIVALSPGIKEGIISTGQSEDRVTVIPNSSDLDLFHPDLDGTSSREKLNLGDRFAGVYFGAMGLANGLEYIVEAARILKQRENDRVVLVLHGGGSKRDELEAMVRSYALENVVFSDPVPDKLWVAQIVAGCDACMTIYRQTDKEQSWSPNKMFDALAAGRPVLINVPGWLGDMIEHNECGRYVDPERPEALADALEGLAAKPQLCQELGRNARALAEREFARDKLADRLERVLLGALQTRVG